VIVTGAHGMFSAGYDIGEIPDEEFEERAERLVAHPFTQAIDALEAFPLPTLAVLPGHTIGGGLELALACDLRIAAGEVKLGMPPAKLGLVYSHTGLRRFIDAIGAPRTRELFLLGAHIDAATALAWGLVDAVAAPDQLDAVALDLAVELAANAPLSQRGNMVIEEPLAVRGELQEVEDELIELRRASFASEDMREGVRAPAERRPPRWQGRQASARPHTLRHGAADHPRGGALGGEIEDHARMPEALVAWRARGASRTRPTCARLSTPSPAAVRRTAGSARSRASPRPRRRCTR
jgi:enoyl-CoA hydratase/carnithine racemase